ncbi:uncharacterized protein LOC121870771 isoform X2 [Homarus americanus]|uniref:uncharacterized protein LOC121870771 isoform X2 n=1 Tax=Homarus americanus TaxID=6706 RepID=UPI001C45F1E7|nr:uncharacterized protein LOC121870771 isoform X2 [Homarus americanus]
MGDERSDTSSVWPTDELDFVNEFPQETQHSPEDRAVAKEREEAVSAAVSVVVASARHGVIALCASVAHIIREKMRLQQNVVDLEKKLAALEKNSTTNVSVTCPCTSPGQVADSHSLLESPTSQRCGSAPPSFITSSLKFSKGGSQNVTGSYQISDQRSVVVVDKCNSCQLLQHPERRTSTATNPDNYLHPAQKNGETKTPFQRGQSYSSTRSLNIGRSPPSSSFMRKKYNSISLRRVRHSSISKQGALPGTWSSSNSHRSSANSLECRGSTSRASSKSCIVTVAEVYPPPPNLTALNTESDAVRLLARKLTNVIQENEAQLEDNLTESPACDPNISDVMMQQISTQELCAPHPLAGCECVVCTHLAADPHSQLYILTTNEGSLLPQGSKVLVQGDRIGTVMYFGHNKYSSVISCLPRHHLKASASTSTTQAAITEASVESSKMISDETDGVVSVDSTSPIGVTITLWPPDQGEVFVPLCDVICQLDDEVDIQSKDHLLGLDLEYVDDDMNTEEVRPPVPSGTHIYPIETVNEKLVQTPDMGDSGIPAPPKMYAGVRALRNGADVPEWKNDNEEAFVRSLSISSYNSDSVHRFGDLSHSDEEGGVEDLTACGMVTLQIPVQDNKSSEETSYLDANLHLSSSHDHENVVPIIKNFETPCLNTTYLYQTGNEEDSCSKTNCSESKVSLYDTSDSAISLTFIQRPQSFEESSDPPSLTDPDRDSHFKDTWDSGCYMETGRGNSESSEQFSIVEGENNQLGSPWACNLSQALDSVWEKYKNLEDFRLDGNCSTRKMDLSKREVQQRDYSSRLQLLLDNPEVATSQSFYIDSSITEHTEV